MCEVLRILGSVCESDLEEVFGHEREHLEASWVKNQPGSDAQMRLDFEMAWMRQL